MKPGVVAPHRWGQLLRHDGGRFGDEEGLGVHPTSGPVPQAGEVRPRVGLNLVLQVRHSWGRGGGDATFSFVNLTIHQC